MPLLSKVREQISRGMERAALKSGVDVNSDVGWTVLSGGLSKLLPGTKYDYKKEAGDLWDNSVVRIALKWMEDTFDEPRLAVERPKANGEKETLYEHPYLTLLEEPNPFYEFSVLLAGTNLSLMVDGNAYLHKLRSAAGAVAGLEYVPHFLLEPKKDKGPESNGWIDYYEYRQSGGVRRIEASEIIHLRDGCDPRNIRKGLSRLGGVLREVCTVNEAATFAASLLRNAGIPSIMISPKDALAKPLSAPEIKEYKKRWKQTFTKDNRGEPWIDGIPVDVHSPGFSPEQMVLDKVQSIPATVICAAFNLDPMVLSLPSPQKTYSNYQEANEAAYRQCVLPSLKSIAKQLTRGLRGEVPGVLPNDRIAYDFSDVQALQEDENERVKRFVLAAGGPIMTPNEARAEIGLDALDGKDELREKQPMARPNDQGQGTEGNPADAEEAKRKDIPPEKLAFAEKWRARRKEPEEDAGEETSVEDVLGKTERIAKGEEE